MRATSEPTARRAPAAPQRCRLGGGMLLTPLALCPQLKVTDSAVKRTERTAAVDADLAAKRREIELMRQESKRSMAARGHGTNDGE